MDELRLEPHAVKVRVASKASSPGEGFGSEVAVFVDALARRCSREENALIGHIKGFATGPDESYLWVSVVDPRRPADVEGEISGSPESIMLSLNIHVFGLSKKRIKEILIESAADPAVRERMDISLIEPLELVTFIKEGKV